MLQDKQLDPGMASAEMPARRRLTAEQKGLLFAALLMMLAGWAALAQLISTTRPRIGGEIWLFFVLLQIAMTGTSIPVWLLLGLRASAVDKEGPSIAVIVRRSIWVGMLVVACAWLMIPRALSLPFTVILLLFFGAIEVFLRNRESAHER